MEPSGATAFARSGKLGIIALGRTSEEAEEPIAVDLPCLLGL